MQEAGLLRSKALVVGDGEGLEQRSESLVSGEDAVLFPGASRSA